MKKGLTELVFIIDRSGSMGGMESDTIGGFNATLNAHRKEDGEAMVTTVLFDTDRSVLHDRIPIADVANMTEDDYQVRGCTALLDAVGTTIEHISQVHKYLPDEYVPEHTIVVITTDGLENASRKFSYKDIKNLISQKEELGWGFLFLGANIDAPAEAERIGIHADRAATYIADKQGNDVMYGAVSAETVRMRIGKPKRGATWKLGIERDTASRGK